MNKLINTIACASLALFAAACVSGGNGVVEKTDGNRVSYKFADNKKPLVNAGMGWVHHYYSGRTGNYGYYLEPSDSLDWFPGANVQYMRIPWAFVEPEDGKFNWSVFDTPAQRYVEKGKKFAIRINCCEHWIPWATPKWLKDKGCKGVQFPVRRGPDPNGACWEPDYLDPIYLEHLERLIKALAERYDGNPNVAFIDIGTFGLWGEGHTGASSKLPRDVQIKAVKLQIDIYTKYFKKTQLCISDDVDGWKEQKNFPVLDYARAKGVSLRDDSILVDIPEAPNPKKKGHVKASWYHADLAGRYWRTMPVIVEHEHYGLSKARGAWKGEWLENAVEAYHCSYLSIHWWPRQFLDENRESIERINLRLGYRLNLAELNMPRSVEIGERFPVQFTWANVGVAPCYNGGFAAITLKDDKGGVVAVLVDDGLDMSTLPVAPKGQPKFVSHVKNFNVGFLNPKKFFNEFTLNMEKRDGAEFYGAPVVPATKAGTYDVYVSVGLRDGTPQINLPLDLPTDGHKRYKIGTITVKEPKVAGVEIKTPENAPLSTMDYDANGKKFKW